MNKHILRCSIGILFTFLLGGCAKYARTEVFPEIFINKSPVRGFVGQEIQLTASPTDKYTFEWKSDDIEVATVNDKGLVKLLKEGSTSIWVTANSIRQKVDVISSTRVPLVDVTLSQTAIDLIPQGRTTISYKILPDNANDIPTIVWSSDDNTIATVSELGEILGIAEGTTTITYTAGEIVKTVKVTVSFTRAFNGPHTLQTGPTVEVMAADFDFGGLGFAFQDDPGNSVGNDNYRRSKGDTYSFPVEIEGSGTNIGYTAAGEWLQYTVDVKDAGTYQLQISLSANGNGKYIIYVDDVDATGTIDVPSNGSWSSWVNHPGVPLTLNLTEGAHKIKFHFVQSGFNLRSLRFTKPI